MSENPYSSPVMTAGYQEPVTAIPCEFELASQGKRFLNLILDSIFVQILSRAGAFGVGVVYAASRIATGNEITSEDQSTLYGLGLVTGLSISIGYYVLMESVCRRTLAKFITRTIVLDENGDRPTLKQILGRSLARLIPFEAFSFLGNNTPVGWHDSLSGTRVVVLK